MDPGFQEELSTVLWELQVLGTCERISKKIIHKFETSPIQGVS